MVLVVALATLIGVLLGLLGGGGSILTVPVLVYLVNQAPKQAIVTSLVVVGVTSVIAVISYARRGLVCWKTGAVFGAAGAVGAFFGGRLAGYVPDKILLMFFALVMLGASMVMLSGRKSRPQGTGAVGSPCPVKIPVTAVLFDGVMVGLVTGMAGVGGGFLLVPALSLLTGLPMHAAIGTSLFIITLQCAAALAGHASHMVIDSGLTAVVTTFAVFGSFLGSFLSHRLRGEYLKRGFGLLVLGLACFVLVREVNGELLEQISEFVTAYREFLMGTGAALLSLLIYRLWLHSDRDAENLKGKT